VDDSAGAGRDVSAEGVAGDGWEELGAGASAGLSRGDTGVRALLVAGEDGRADAVEGDCGVGGVVAGAGGVCGGEEDEGADGWGGRVALLASG